MTLSASLWLVYIVHCADGTLYTGCTNNLEQRLQTHNAGKGAHYTKGRGPVELLYTENAANRSEAQKREYEIKQLSRLEKIHLVKNNQTG